MSIVVDGISCYTVQYIIFEKSIEFIASCYLKRYTVHTAFSGQVFAPPKNPLNAVAEGFRKNLKKKFFKLRSNRFHGLFFGQKSCD